VYRIQTICRLLFETTTSFKIFATQDNKIFRQAVPVGSPIRIPKMQVPDAGEIEQKCPKCGIIHKIYAKLASNSQIDTDFKNKGFIPFPKDAKIICKCGFEIDLLGIKNQIEIQTGKEIIVE
jgi:phage FluMu protein Com